MSEGCRAGIDIVSISRMKEASGRESFLKRVFTGQEIEYARKKKRPEKHLAGRFAAKEAVIKALSRGVLSGLSLRDIEVVNDENGRPGVRLRALPAEALAVGPVHLSLSYTDDFAFAFVVIG